MDLNYLHGTEIYVLRACPNDDAADLVAIGGEQSVEVLLVVCRLSTIGCHSTLTAEQEGIQLPASGVISYWFEDNSPRMVSKDNFAFFQR